MMPSSTPAFVFLLSALLISLSFSNNFASASASASTSASTASTSTASTTTTTSASTSSISSVPHDWHRLGLGRTIHVFSRNATSDLVVLTSLAIVARIDLQTSQIRWRILPPLSSQRLHPIAAVTLRPPEVPSTVLLVLLSDFTLRAIDPVSATVIWHTSARHVYPPNNVINQKITVIPVKTSTGTVQLLDPITGVARHVALSFDDVNLQIHHGQPYPDININEVHHRDLSWHLYPTYTVMSGIDGALCLCRRDDDDDNENEDDSFSADSDEKHSDNVGTSSTSCTKEIWRREDGIAHVSAATLITHRVPIVNNNNPIVVLLSSLGALYAISDESDKPVLWKIPVPRYCLLLPAMNDYAVVVCTISSSSTDGDSSTINSASGENDLASTTIVRAVHIGDGRVVFEQSKQGLRATRASLEPCQCNICVIVTDTSAHMEYVFSSCVQTPISCTKRSSAPSLPSDRGWLVYSTGGQEIRGVRNGVTAWRLAMPNNARISKVTTYSYPSTSSSSQSPSSSSTTSSSSDSVVRPPPVRVTGARKLLRKFVNEDAILVLAHDDERAELHALIVDGASGTLYDARAHQVAQPPVAAVRADHWFVYSFWNTAMLQHELHVVDMYDPPRKNASSWVGHTVRAAVRALFGREIMSALGIPDPDFTIECRGAENIPSGTVETDTLNQSSTSDSTSSTSSTSSSTSSSSSSSYSRSYSSNSTDPMNLCSSLSSSSSSISAKSQQCTTGDGRDDSTIRRRRISTMQKPKFARSSVLLTRRVIRLDVTQSSSGIAEPSVIMTLENGQVTLVPKFFLDARRPQKSQLKDNLDTESVDSMLHPYEPVLFLESGARKSRYIAEGTHISTHGGTPPIVVVAPVHGRESASLILVAGIDIVLSTVQPLGSFDALPKDDFLYSGVVAMLIGLTGAVVYTNRLKRRVLMKKSW